MKLDPEDPRLSSYLLGELPADESAAIEHAVAADPALGMAMQELEHVHRLLTNSLSPATTSLLPRQREAILRAARHAGNSTPIHPPPSQPRPFRALLIPLAAAAMITLAVVILVRLPSGNQPIANHPPTPEQETTLPLEIALLPAPGPADASSSTHSDARPTASSNLAEATASRATALDQQGDLFLRKIAERLAQSPTPTAEELPPLRQRGHVSATEHPSLPLPIHAGRASLAWITHSIRESKSRPPANAVRLEEILNHFPLRPAGPTAVSHGVTLSTELVSCPWKPSASLLLVSFRGAADTAREVTATFHVDPSTVRRYRLLGFAPLADLHTTSPLPSRLLAKSITTLVIEIEPSTTTNNLGTLEWHVNHQPAPPLAITRHGDSEPSEDARFATLVCTFAQWLTREPSALIDVELLAALARETAAETMPAERIDFLNLIDQSLDL